MVDKSSMSLATLERELVIAQLERILADPLFRNSRRFPPLLKHVVMQALENKTDRLRERDLGVDVFARDPDYDTIADPVVRVTAGEIRKRLAQYYSNPAHDGEVRFCLPAGHYVPEFRTAEPVPAPLPPALFPVAAAAPVPRRSVPRWRILAAILVLAASGLALRSWIAQTPLDRLWAPLIDGSDPVFISVGETAISDAPASTAPAFVADSDVEMLSALLGRLASGKKAYVVKGAFRTSLADLRTGPAVLVGGFNNAWAMRLTARTRFSFEQDDVTRYIADRQHPAGRDWSTTRAPVPGGRDKDYALITRTLSPETGRMVIIAAGIHRHGTVAAGEFLTDPKYMEEVAAKAPSGWYRKNFQIVLATNVINDNSGPPRVVAVDFW